MARVISLLAALFCLLTGPAHGADEAVGRLSFADRIAIRQVVSAQLAALRHDDATLAFSYASPAIRQRFGTADNFLNMVRVAYPSVYRPRDMQFRQIEATEEGPVQQVFFIAPNSEPLLGLYYMEKEPDGSWKINGCQLAPAPDLSI